MHHLHLHGIGSRRISLRHLLLEAPAVPTAHHKVLALVLRHVRELGGPLLLIAFLHYTRPVDGTEAAGHMQLHLVLGTRQAKVLRLLLYNLLCQRPLQFSGPLGCVVADRGRALFDGEARHGLAFLRDGPCDLKHLALERHIELDGIAAHAAICDCRAGAALRSAKVLTREGVAAGSVAEGVLLILPCLDVRHRPLARDARLITVCDRLDWVHCGLHKASATVDAPSQVVGIAVRAEDRRRCRCLGHGWVKEHVWLTIN
mmetsp:Transcript_73970/g.163492  ORF Transcript_73970/g.163492 Transcript_73970/m.163492 type:complete len:259 (+) Transcript_73970:719-1495(+)